MESYEFKHELAGIYPDQGQARQAYDAFVEAGFGERELRLMTPEEFDTDPDQVSRDIEPESAGTRDQIIKDTAMGAAAGGGVGAAGAAGIGLMAPALFAAGPVVAPLMVMGYGALIGGMGGAVSGLHLEKTHLAAVVEDALKGGMYAVLVHTRDEQAYERAHDVMADTVAETQVEG